MMFPKRGKPSSRMKRVKVLDEVFSRWLRLSRSDKNGLVRCFTCDKLYPWQEMDAGHYVSRRYYATRWDPRNVKPQCVQCNRFREGEKGVFHTRIDAVYGEGTAERLDLFARIQPLAKYANEQIEELILRYRERLKDLKRN